MVLVPLPKVPGSDPTSIEPGTFGRGTAEEATMEKGEFVSHWTREWKHNPRWNGIKRPYSAEDVYKLKGTVHREHSIARAGATRLWELLNEEKYIHVLSAVTGN